MIPKLIQRTVDLVRKKSKTKKVDQLDEPLYELEQAGHTFEITVLDDGEAADISGTVSARFLRADETTVYFTGTLSGNVASVTLPLSCYTVNGRFSMVIFISGSDVTNAIYGVAGSVFRSTSDTIVDPADEVPTLEQLIAKIDECEAATTAATTAATNANNAVNYVASVYAASTAYAIGDYVIYDGALYRCNTAVDTSTDWATDSGSFTAVTGGISSEVVDLNAAVVDSVSKMDIPRELYDASAITEHTVIRQNGTTATVSTYQFCVTDYIPLIPGASYTYTGLTFISGTYSNAVVYDHNKSILSVFALATGTNTITAGEGQYYIRFCVNTHDDYRDDLTFSFRKNCVPNGVTVEVAQDGTRAFRTISEAYAYAYSIADADTPVTILIYPGTYDEALNATAAGGYAWSADKKISFIGINKQSVIWRDTSGLYANAPLHTSMPGLIKGITFIANHDGYTSSNYASYAAFAAAGSAEGSQYAYASYALHLDDATNNDVTGQTYAFYDTVIEDCDLTSCQFNAAGIGTRPGQTITFRNCTLKADIPDDLMGYFCSTKGAIGVHGAYGGELEYPNVLAQKVVFDNCRIESTETLVITASYFYVGEYRAVDVEFVKNFVWSDADGVGNSDSCLGSNISANIMDTCWGNSVVGLNKLSSSPIATTSETLSYLNIT